MMLKQCFILAATLLIVVAVEGEVDNHTAPRVTLPNGPKPQPITETTTKYTTTTPTSTTTSTTSTPAPITTSSPPTSTTPLPPAEKGKWAYTDPKTNKTCVIVQMATQLNVSYIDTNNKIVYTVFDVPVNNATQILNGSCESDMQSITLFWECPETMLNNTMKLTFVLNTTDKDFALSNMEFDIVQDAKLFPGSNGTNKILKLVYTGETFSTPVAMSYRCAKSQSIILTDAEHQTNSTVSISDMQLQAFNTEKGNTFGNANDCDYVTVPDIIPIAVGCALGGLVLIVLIAYLVGRRRRLAPGYLSM